MKTRILAIALTTALPFAAACDEEPELDEVVDDEPALVIDEPELAAPELEDDDTVVIPPPSRVQPGLTLLAVDVECRPGAIFFATDSAELEDGSEEKLEAMAECLKGTPRAEDVTVRGRTDPRASEDYNEALAQQRATAVVSYLQTHGVDESTFEIVAIGEDGATEGMPKLYPTQRNATVRPQ